VELTISSLNSPLRRFVDFLPVHPSHNAGSSKITHVHVSSALPMKIVANTSPLTSKPTHTSSTRLTSKRVAQALGLGRMAQTLPREGGHQRRHSVTKMAFFHLRIFTRAIMNQQQLLNSPRLLHPWRCSCQHLPNLWICVRIRRAVTQTCHSFLQTLKRPHLS
jgi:hypothetical protein